MRTEPISETPAADPQAGTRSNPLTTLLACIAGYCVPGLGHALLRKWDRAAVFFGSIVLMFAFGLMLEGRVVQPESSGLFAILKFLAEAGAGLLDWGSMLQGIGPGEPTAYTFDYANVFLYVAGLLNMLGGVDAFDIAMGRKQ